MDVFRQSPRLDQFSPTPAWRRYAPALVAFVALRMTTGSLLLAVGVAAGLAFAGSRAGRRKPKLPESKDFTPPFGTPAITLDRPYYGVPQGMTSAPGTHHQDSSKDVAIDHPDGHAFDNLDYDPVGQLVHGLRSSGFATLRAKAIAKVTSSKAPKTSKSSEVFIRDDRGSAKHGAFKEATKSVDNVDSLLTFLSTGSKRVGYSKLGWKVISNSKSSTGHWTAVLQAKNGNTVTLRLVDPKTFATAVRGSEREIATRSVGQDRSFGRELHKNLR